MTTTAKHDTANMSKKRFNKVARQLNQVLLGDAVFIMNEYAYFRQNGGKRPVIHDRKGKKIAPACPTTVKVFEQRLGYTALEATPVPSRRQKVRDYRRIAQKMPTRQKWAERNKVGQQTEQVVTVTAMPEKVQQFTTEHYGKTEVLAKRFGDRTTVIAFYDGRNNGEGWDKPKRRTVYRIENGVVTESSAKSGGAKTMPIEKFEGSGWKWGKLHDHSEILDFKSGVHNATTEELKLAS